MSPVTFWLLVLALIVGNQVIVGLFCRHLAYEKNRDGRTWFWLGFLFGPMPIALLTLIGLPVVPADEADHRRRWMLLRNTSQLQSISTNEAALLAKRHGALELTRLTTLSDEAAKALAEHKGDFLSLDGLTTLSDEAAKALAQHKGWLYLGGLTTLSDEAAKALAQRERRLYLDGLTTLSDEAATALRANPKVRLPKKFRS